MATENLKGKIEEIIKDSFKELEKIYLCCCDNQSMNTERGVIFPRYSKQNIRVSEQELRCVFIQELCERGLHYSVETPTIKKYTFTDKDNPKVYDEKDSDCGESARIDLTIHDKNDLNKRLCIIEFKAHGGTSEHNYKKDLLKLYAEPDGSLRYFIQIFESFNGGTSNSVKDKLKKSSEYIINKYGQNVDTSIFDKVQCRFYSFKFGSAEYNNHNIYEKLLNDENNNS